MTGDQYAMALNPLLYGDEDATRETLAVFNHSELLVAAWAGEQLARLAMEQIEKNIRINRGARFDESRSRR